MASPIAHSITALMIHESAGWRRRFVTIAAFVVLANVCDFDMVLSKFVTGDHNEWHRGPSHSVLFCAFVAALVAAFWRTGSSYLQRFAVLFALTGSHLIIDFVTGPRLGFVRSYGVPFLWPFSDSKFACPVSLIVGPRHKDISQILDWANLLSAAYEALLFGALGLLVVMVVRTIRGRNAGRIEPQDAAESSGTDRKESP